MRSQFYNLYLSFVWHEFNLFFFTEGGPSHWCQQLHFDLLWLPDSFSFLMLFTPLPWAPFFSSYLGFQRQQACSTNILNDKRWKLLPSKCVQKSTWWDCCHPTLAGVIIHDETEATHLRKGSILIMGTTSSFTWQWPSQNATEPFLRQ